MRVRAAHLPFPFLFCKRSEKQGSARRAGSYLRRLKRRYHGIANDSGSDMIIVWKNMLLLIRRA